MRFHITRTSQFDVLVKPCPEAVQGQRDVYQYYTFRSVAEANKRYPDMTFEKVGSNRVRSTAGTEKAWFVELDTLDDLVELHYKYGPLVIEHSYDNLKEIEIEIYDGYRE